MIFAYLRTKLCSLKMNRDRLSLASWRSRRRSRVQRPSLGIAAVVRTRVVGWSLPARVVRGRAGFSPPWQTPAVVIVDALTTTSIGALSLTPLWKRLYYKNNSRNSNGAVAGLALHRSEQVTCRYAHLRCDTMTPTQVHIGIYLPQSKPITTVLERLSEQARSRDERDYALQTNAPHYSSQGEFGPCCACPTSHTDDQTRR